MGALRDHLIELGSLPPDEADQFKVFKTSLLIAGGMINFGMAAGLFAWVLGVGSMVAGNPALGQALLGGLCLWAGGTAAACARAGVQFASLIAHKPKLPAKARPTTRTIGRTWLPLTAGAGVALATSFAISAQLKPAPDAPVAVRPAVTAQPTP